MRILRRVLLGLAVIFVIGAIGNYLDPVEPKPVDSRPPAPAAALPPVPVPPMVPVDAGPTKPPADVAPALTPKVSGKARREEIVAIRNEIARLQNIGANVMDGLRNTDNIAQLAKCQPLRREADAAADALKPRIEALEPEDFELKVAAGEVKMCASCMRNADFYCGQVERYLKKKR